MENSNKLETGLMTDSGNFVLTKKVESLDELWEIINSKPSIFARHKMYPTAFFRSWHLRLCKNWIDNGWLWDTDEAI